MENWEKWGYVGKSRDWMKERGSPNPPNPQTSQPCSKQGLKQALSANHQMTLTAGAWAATGACRAEALPLLST